MPAMTVYVPDDVYIKVEERVRESTKELKKTLTPQERASISKEANKSSLVTAALRSYFNLR